MRVRSVLPERDRRETGSVREPERETPLFDRVEVVVVGGGPAGCCAALAAARSGRRTLLLEQLGSLGGMMGPAGHPHIGTFNASGGDERVVGGIGFGICERLVEMGAGSFTGGGNTFDYELESMKHLLDVMMDEAGVRILFHTICTEAMGERGAAEGVFLHNKAGRQAVSADVVVDCTGDADIAASCGARFEKGRPDDGMCQPATLMFRVEGVDRDELLEAQRTYGWKLTELWRRAIEAGDMDPFQTETMGFWMCDSRPDRVWVNFTNIRNVDATVPEDVSLAEMEGRRQARTAMEAMRRHIPGFADAHMTDTADYLGIRESRRIVGLERLEVEDLLSCRKYPERSVARGSAFVDVHHPSETGLHEPQTLLQGGYYGIPYGCMVPDGVTGLLVAGRSISVSHRALGSTRWMAQCMALGHAAGAAASLCIEMGADPEELDIGLLRSKLLSEGALI